jgi:hypothetical protein
MTVELPNPLINSCKNRTTNTKGMHNEIIITSASNTYSIAISLSLDTMSSYLSHIYEISKTTYAAKSGTIASTFKTFGTHIAPSEPLSFERIATSQ